MKKIITRVTAILAICAILYTVIGFWVAPLIVKPIAEDKLSEALHRNVTIEKIRMNPYVMSVGIENCEIAEDGTSGRLLSVGNLYVNVQSSSIFKKALILKELKLEKPFLHVRRTRVGMINLVSLASSGKKAGETQGTDVSGDRKSDAVGIPIVQCDSISVTKGDIIFTDAALRSVKEPVDITIQNLSVTGTNISTASESTGDVTLAFEDDAGGTVSIGGPVGVNPVSANLTVSVDDYNLLPFRGHVLDQVGLIIEGGTVGTEGTLTVSQSENGLLTASYGGTAAVSHFSSVDEKAKEPLIAFESFRFRTVEAGFNPTFLTVDNITVTDFYAGLIINPDKTINVLTIAKKGKSGEKTAPVPVFGPIDIQEINFENGHVNFTDKSIKPTYSSNLYNIDGAITGLTSKNTRRARVALKGKLDKTVPVNITGELEPFSEELFAHVRVSMESKDLSPLTPYSGKFLGYVIDKGNLVMNLDYTIEGKKLVSRNKIFIDQLTLGEKVDSPDALSLPVKLGIALLKNRKGEIDLDVPVTGRTDDPEFSIGYFVLKIIGNIIEKVVTAPFAFIGSLFGGEELGYVEFDPGSVAVTERSAEKLDILAKALYDRPMLKLEIEGHVDVDVDTARVKQVILDKKVKSAKYDDYITKALKTPPVEKVTIQADEYRQYLIAAYLTEKNITGDKERQELEKLETDAVEEMMRENIAVTESDLRHLAYERASRVMDHILRSDTVEKERLFLVEPKNLQAEKRDGVRSSRVDFNLK